MSRKLLKEALTNAAFGAIIMFGVTILAGGWQLKKPKAVQESPELQDAERQEPVEVTAPETVGDAD